MIWLSMFFGMLILFCGTFVVLLCVASMWSGVGKALDAVSWVVHLSSCVSSLVFSDEVACPPMLQEGVCQTFV